jgi:hypothetical protein
LGNVVPLRGGVPETGDGHGGLGQRNSQPDSFQSTDYLAHTERTPNSSKSDGGKGLVENAS